MPAPQLTIPESIVARVWAFVRTIPIMLITPTALVLVNLVQIFAFCIKPFSRHAFLAINQGVSRLWADATVIATRVTHGTRIVLSGDRVPPDENAIILCNHQQMADVNYLTHWAQPLGRTGDMKFFTKDPVKYVPGLGWALAMLSFPFVKRNWTRDRDAIARVFARITGDDIPVWLITFPEGTRITPAKHEAAVAFAAEHGLRSPLHTLVPRTKGFAAAVRGLRQHATAIYDVTLGYPQGVTSLWHYIVGYSNLAHVHVRRFSMQELPQDDERLRQWLVDRFEEKDRLLEAFYSNGAFPSS